MGRENLVMCAAAAAIIAQSIPAFVSDVDVVRVTVTVTDRDGRFITGLKKDDFRVFEDGRPREVLDVSDESEPVSLGILVDTSGSMNPGKVRLAREAITRLVANGLTDSDEWFLARFGFSLSVVAEWTNDRAAIVQPLRDITHTTGDTALLDAVSLSVPLVENGRYQKAALLVVSDGRETKSLMTLDLVTRAIGQRDVRVYGIGVDSADARRGEHVDMTTLRRLAAETAGVAESASDLAAAQAAAVRISEELQHEYLLTFSTQQRTAGIVHAIRVDTRRSGARVRARKTWSS